MDSNTNTPLRLITPKANIGFLTQSDAPDFLLDLGDPALDLLTDFRLTPAISVLATTQIDDALTQHEPKPGLGYPIRNVGGEKIAVTAGRGATQHHLSHREPSPQTDTLGGDEARLGGKDVFLQPLL